MPIYGFPGDPRNDSFSRSPRAHAGKVGLSSGLPKTATWRIVRLFASDPAIAGYPRGTVMTSPAISTKLPLEPPGPGSWEQDPVHFPRPMTRYFQETHPPAFEKGTSEFARLYGMLTGGLRMRYVEGLRLQAGAAGARG